MSREVTERKEQSAAILKYDAGAGTGTALFSRYFVEDADGDVTTDTFLPNGQIVPMLIGHVWSETPVGKGKIRSTHEAGYFDFTLADTPRGRELGEWLRFDYADGQPKSEFSYGFKVLDGGSSYETVNGRRRRVLHGRPDGSAGGWVREVSYVLAGSGVSTALIDMKGAEQYRWKMLHEKVNRAVEAEHQREQAEIQAMYRRFLAKHRR